MCVEPDHLLRVWAYIIARRYSYSFIGRGDGVIDVGGLKVHPEAAEAVINRHPAIGPSRVYGRVSPIIGALIMAGFVLKTPAASGGAPGAPEAEIAAIVAELLDPCRTELPAHAVPVMLRALQSLQISSAGKLMRG